MLVVTLFIGLGFIAGCVYGRRSPADDPALFAVPAVGKTDAVLRLDDDGGVSLRLSNRATWRRVFAPGSALTSHHQAQGDHAHMVDILSPRFHAVLVYDQHPSRSYLVRDDNDGLWAFRFRHGSLHTYSQILSHSDRPAPLDFLNH
ncbi:MAG: hypothetical protein EA402_12300 [Planctomycetota bacterium]|nr:MAG: hypothetical protein EA402_12300 [Planctomycetota bacterium]